MISEVELLALHTKNAEVNHGLTMLLAKLVEKVSKGTDPELEVALQELKTKSEAYTKTALDIVRRLSGDRPQDITPPPTTT